MMLTSPDGHTGAHHVALPVGPQESWAAENSVVLSASRRGRAKKALGRTRTGRSIQAPGHRSTPLVPGPVPTLAPDQTRARALSGCPERQGPRRLMRERQTRRRSRRRATAAPEAKTAVPSARPRQSSSPSSKHRDARGSQLIRPCTNISLVTPESNSPASTSRASAMRTSDCTFIRPRPAS